MTWIISMADYKKHRLAPVAYLDAACRGSGLREEHTAKVLQARRDKEAHPVPAGRDPVAAPIPRLQGGAHSDPAPLSPIARIDAWYQRNWVWCFAWTAVVSVLLGVAYGIVTL